MPDPSSSSSSSSSGIEVFFDTDPIKVGLSTLCTLTKTVNADIYPSGSAARVSFGIDNSSRASVTELSRTFVAGDTPDEDHMRVALQITGSSATPQTSPDGDACLYANCDDGTELASASVIVLVPKYQSHSVGSANLQNTTEVDGTYIAFRTLVYRDIAITIYDQFSATLNSLFDGTGYVSESFDDAHQTSGNGIGFPTGTITSPDGALSSGLISDRCGALYRVRYPSSSVTGTMITNWTNGNGIVIDGTTYTNALAIRNVGMGRPADAGNARQTITCHGYEVTPKYRRSVEFNGANSPPISVTETSE